MYIYCIIIYIYIYIYIYILLYVCDVAVMTYEYSIYGVADKQIVFFAVHSPFSLRCSLGACVNYICNVLVFMKIFTFIIATCTI